MRRLDPEGSGEATRKLEEFFLKWVRGQDDAIKRLVGNIDLHDSGFRDPNRPIYSGLFLGPSGVGKTLMAEVLAEHWFGSRKAFTKIACAQYREPHRIADLIGSPAGYVGFYNPNDPNYRGVEPQLSQRKIDQYDHLSRLVTDRDMAEGKKKVDELWAEYERLDELMREAFRRKDASELKRLKERQDALNNMMFQLEKKFAYNPNKYNYRSIILFDEIEKADTALHNLLLEINDKAAIKLASGQMTRFNNSVILLTSNVGSKQISEILKGKKGIGFTAGDDQNKKDEDIYRKASQAAYDVFSPEFLGRLRISVFRPLSKKTLLEIFDCLLKEFESELAAKKLPLVFKLDPEVKEFIVDEASDRVESGARLLRNKIGKYLREPLSRLKNRGELAANDILVFKLEEEGGVKKIAVYKENG